MAPVFYIGKYRLIIYSGQVYLHDTKAKNHYETVNIKESELEKIVDEIYETIKEG